MSVSTIPVVTGRLGKLPARLDVRTLSLARYVDRVQLPTAPVELDLTLNVPKWPVYANDRIGDCTTAAAGRMIEAWTAAGRGRAVEISERSVLTAFDRVKIVDPATGEEGAVELDVLRDWRKHGIGRHRIGAFARIAVHDHELARTAAWLFGGLYIGLQMPLSAQRQHTWDWLGWLTGPARPSYCILSLDFLDGGYAPNGFDLEALRADLALVTA